MEQQHPENEQLAGYRQSEADALDAEDCEPLGFSRLLGRNLREYEIMRDGALFHMTRQASGRRTYWQVDPAGNPVLSQKH
jgi:hypothetical protein